MSPRSANLLGLFITILAGTYFYLTLCSHCGAEDQLPGIPLESNYKSVERTSDPTFSMKASLVLADSLYPNRVAEVDCQTGPGTELAVENQP